MIREGDRVSVPDWLLDGKAEYYVVRVVGEAMIEDGICDGDFLIVRRCSTPADGEMIIALVGDDAIVRRFYHEGETARLVPVNPTMQPICLPLAQFTVQGVVTGLIRRFDRKERMP